MAATSASGPPSRLRSLTGERRQIRRIDRFPPQPSTPWQLLSRRGLSSGEDTSAYPSARLDRTRPAAAREAFQSLTIRERLETVERRG
jgi:hypothetical protein